MEELFANPTESFAMLFCLSVALVTVHEGIVHYTHYEIDSSRHSLIGRLRLPAIKREWHLVLSLLLAVSLLMCSADLFGPFALGLSFVLYFPVYAQMPRLGRKTNLYPFVILILVFVPIIPERVISGGTLWPLLFVKTLIGLVYLSSFIQKAKYAWKTWLTGSKLLNVVQYHDLLYGSNHARFFENSPRITKMVSCATLFFEATFWTCIFFGAGPWSMAYGTVAILFHFLLLLFLRINYLKFYFPILIVFFL
jgi:hypothetical protein